MTTELDDEHRKGIKEAVEKCAETVNRAMVSLLAVALFCLLTTLGASDRSLVAPEASIKIPFAEVPISFVGFVIVAPLLLLVLTLYLHVFYGYWRELDTTRQAQGLPETYPALFSIDRKISRLLTAFIFYWLTPTGARRDRMEGFGAIRVGSASRSLDSSCHHRAGDSGCRSPWIAKIEVDTTRFDRGAGNSDARGGDK